MCNTNNLIFLLFFLDDEVEYAGDNFVRVTGDTVEHARAQLFAWEAASKGLDVQALAEPTKLEALKREYVSKKTELKVSENIRNS